MKLEPLPGYAFPPPLNQEPIMSFLNSLRDCKREIEHRLFLNENSKKQNMSLSLDWRVPNKLNTKYGKTYMYKQNMNDSISNVYDCGFVK